MQVKWMRKTLNFYIGINVDRESNHEERFLCYLFDKKQY